MVRIREFNDYFKGMLVKVPALKSFLLVASESDLANKIRNLSDGDFPLLIVLIPSADSIALDPDNVTEASTCLLYVVRKLIPDASDDVSFLNLMEDTQNIFTAVKLQLATDKANHDTSPHFMHRMDLNRMHSDPEYNYLGCVGWSLSFNLFNLGF